MNTLAPSVEAPVSKPLRSRTYLAASVLDGFIASGAGLIVTQVQRNWTLGTFDGLTLGYLTSLPVLIPVTFFALFALVARATPGLLVVGAHYSGAGWGAALRRAALAAVVVIAAFAVGALFSEAVSGLQLERSTESSYSSINVVAIAGGWIAVAAGAYLGHMIGRKNTISGPTPTPIRVLTGLAVLPVTFLTAYLGDLFFYVYRVADFVTEISLDEYFGNTFLWVAAVSLIFAPVAYAAGGDVVSRLCGYRPVGRRLLGALLASIGLVLANAYLSRIVYDVIIRVDTWGLPSGWDHFFRFAVPPLLISLALLLIIWPIVQFLEKIPNRSKRRQLIGAGIGVAVLVVTAVTAPVLAGFLESREAAKQEAAGTTLAEEWESLWDSRVPSHFWDGESFTFERVFENREETYSGTVLSNEAVTETLIDGEVVSTTRCNLDYYSCAHPVPSNAPYVVEPTEITTGSNWWQISNEDGESARATLDGGVLIVEQFDAEEPDSDPELVETTTYKPYRSAKMKDQPVLEDAPAGLLPSGTACVDGDAGGECLTRAPSFILPGGIAVYQ